MLEVSEMVVKESMCMMFRSIRAWRNTATRAGFYTFPEFKFRQLSVRTTHLLKNTFVCLDLW